MQDSTVAASPDIANLLKSVGPQLTSTPQKSPSLPTMTPLRRRTFDIGLFNRDGRTPLPPPRGLGAPRKLPARAVISSSEGISSKLPESKKFVHLKHRIFLSIIAHR